MRINRFVALTTGMSRRNADKAITEGRIRFNGQMPSPGQDVEDTDRVTMDGHTLSIPGQTITIMLHKPPGFVCSRKGQGSQTIYQLLPPAYRDLKSIGRLDKMSTGLILLTNDGDLANELSHPSQSKEKVYLVRLDAPLQPGHKRLIAEQGIMLDEGLSKFDLEVIEPGDEKLWKVRMHEGRNRQIRRTFEAAGYKVIKLHRVKFGPYSLGSLPQGKFMML